MNTLICFIATLFLIASINAMPYRVPLHGMEAKYRTLILSEDKSVKMTYSTFFEDMVHRGHALTFYDSDINLKSFGEYSFDNIILFTPKHGDFTSVSVEDLKEFIDDGGDLLFIATNEVNDNMRLFAATCGIEFDKKGSSVIDHASFDIDSDPSLRHDSVVVKQVVNLPSVLGDFLNSNDKSVVFRGIGHVVDAENNLAVKLLQGNPSTYSADPNMEVTDFPENVGPDTGLVTIIQGRNNGRMGFAGSAELFSNHFINKHGNRAFCSGLAKWVFGEAGVLRFRNVQHFKSDGNPPDVILHEKERPDLPQTLYPDPEITRNSLVYRIKDEIVYSMVVEEYKNNEWVPFSPSDMQMEFVMLDPHIRKTMTCVQGKCSAVFIAPDNYGVFKFRVFYRRPGYSVLHAETQVSIRPFKHNEYERFIFSAFPYYGSAISALVGFLVLATSFLFVSEKKA